MIKEFVLPTLIGLSLSLSLSVFGQQEKSVNPLLVHSNAAIQFKKITAQDVHDAAAKVIDKSKKIVTQVAAVPDKKKTFANTMMVVDELSYNLQDILCKLSLIAATYSDDTVRDAANVESGNLSVFANDLYLQEPLYKAIRSYSSIANGLRPDQKKFLTETVFAFEKNGMKLGKQDRSDLAALNEKIVKFGVEFDKNIAEWQDSLVFTPAQLSGVPQDLLDKWKRCDDKYVVAINSPNYTALSANARDADTRKQAYLHYQSRAYPANVKVLDSLLHYRDRYAKKLGFRSYAQYALLDKMAAKPENVWALENDLIRQLTPNVTGELSLLSNLKAKDGKSSAINAWDISYYDRKLLNDKYNLDPEEVKQYFEMENTLKGLFSIYEKLFNLKILATKGLPVWDSKVKTYDMYMDGKKMGSFYLDLYPRANKYTHFACFPVSIYRQASGKEVLPVSALVCNFTEASPETPSLVKHADVVTLFHEFGHLVHSLVARSNIASQSLLGIKADFIEAPSQFLENWCYEYEPLSMFAKHYKTGKPLPRELFDKMKAAQKVNIAITYIRQVNYGLVDFTFEDKYDSIKTRNLDSVSKDIGRITQIPYAEDSHFIYSFGHLNSYGANYYGYLWSKVFAEDMFSIFKKNGVMDKTTGLKYRQEVLQKGATKEEIDMLWAFLGREPNADAFSTSIGLK